jgi:hypothetical protein
MATCIQKVAREVFGVTKGKKHEAIKEEYYKSWHHDRSTRNMVKYKEAKKNARRAVSEARGHSYDELYERLWIKEGKKGHI